MSKRSGGLWGNMLGRRWRATSSPAAGTTVVASSPTPSNTTQRINLETLWYSIVNQTGAGALSATVNVQVRSASVAGSVLATVRHFLGASSSANVAITELAFTGKPGQAVVVTMDTVVASLTQAVNACGWMDDDS